MNTEEQDKYVRENFSPKKRRAISKTERIVIAKKTNGKCGYCGIDLPKRWHVDHIEPFAKGGTSCDFDNLMAACPQCNMFKSTHSLKAFRIELNCQVTRAREQSTNFRFAEKYKQIKVTKKPIVFYFESIAP